MAPSDNREKRGWFRRSSRGAAPEGVGAPPAAAAPARRPPLSDDPWSEDAWAEDDWDDPWNDRSRRARVRPAADPRAVDVDAWLESEKTSFDDTTADIARRWTGSAPRPDLGWNDDIATDKVTADPFAELSADLPAAQVPDLRTAQPELEEDVETNEPAFPWTPRIDETDERVAPAPEPTEPYVPYQLPTFEVIEEPTPEEVADGPAPADGPGAADHADQAVAAVVAVELPAIEQPAASEPPAIEPAASEPPALEPAALDQPIPATESAEEPTPPGSDPGDDEWSGLDDSESTQDWSAPQTHPTAPYTLSLGFDDDFDTSIEADLEAEFGEEDRAEIHRAAAVGVDAPTTAFAAPVPAPEPPSPPVPVVVPPGSTWDDDWGSADEPAAAPAPLAADEVDDTGPLEVSLLRSELAAPPAPAIDAWQDRSDDGPVPSGHKNRKGTLGERAAASTPARDRHLDDLDDPRPDNPLDDPLDDPLDHEAVGLAPARRTRRVRPTDAVISAGVGDTAALLPSRHLASLLLTSALALGLALGVRFVLVMSAALSGADTLTTDTLDRIGEATFSLGAAHGILAWFTVVAAALGAAFSGRDPRGARLGGWAAGLGFSLGLLGLIATFLGARTLGGLDWSELGQPVGELTLLGVGSLLAVWGAVRASARR